MYGSLRVGGGIRDFAISNSVFSGNTSNRYVAGPGFITKSTGTVSNCIFASNYTQYTDTTYTSHGCSLGSEARVDFINCTFADTSVAGGVGLSVRRGTEANILNSIFRGTGYRPISLVTAAELGCTVSVNYCNIENGIDSIYVSDTLSILLYGEGNLSMDPLFVDPLHGDYHLTESSPCIGAGINALQLEDKLMNAPAGDIEGASRPSPVGSQADMGAYEHPLGNPAGIQPGLGNPGNENLSLTVYPNPFYQTVSISYDITVASDVELTIYNSLGQPVETLVSAFQQPGEYQVNWNARSRSGGTYFCRMKTERENVQAIKLLLLR